MTQFFDANLIWEYLPKLIGALPVTLSIVIIATLIGLVLGIIIAYVRMEKIPLLNTLATLFVSFNRGTPILVQMYIVYYGLPMVLGVFNIDVTQWPKLAFIYITYGLNTAAFQSETMRAALASVPELQREAAIACGLTPLQMYRHVIIPQMIRVALPSFATTTISLLQDTSLAFTIGIVDVVGKAKAIGAVSFHTLEGYIGSAILFVSLSIVLTHLFNWLEHRVNFEKMPTVQAEPTAITIAPALNIQAPAGLTDRQHILNLIKGDN